jgi:hypothetical protein
MKTWQVNDRAACAEVCNNRKQNGQGIPTFVRVVEDRLLKAHEMCVKKRLILLPPLRKY